MTYPHAIAQVSGTPPDVAALGLTFDILTRLHDRDGHIVTSFIVRVPMRDGQYFRRVPSPDGCASLSVDTLIPYPYPGSSFPSLIYGVYSDEQAERKKMSRGTNN